MSMADRDGWIWYDGKMVPWRDATTHVLTHTLHYGMGVFEGVRCYKTVDGPAIFRLRDHTDRLLQLGAHLRHEDPVHARGDRRRAARVRARATSSTRATCGRSRSTARDAMGVAAKSNPVRVAIAAWPWGAYLGADGARKGHPREDVVVHAPPSQHHDVQREGRRQLHGVDPRQPGSDARRLRGGDAARSAGLRLPGLGRERVHRPRRQAAHAGPRRAARSTASRATRSSRSPASSAFPVIERRITRDEVYIADEAFFTGTAAEVTPIRELDNRHDRQRRARPDHDEAAGAVLRRGQRPRSARRSPG